MTALRGLLARVPLVGGHLSATAWQAIFLFAVDGVTNVVDYLFHLYLGRSLTPRGFAVVQTINSVVLIGATALGVLQPVVARYVAEARAAGEPARARAIFQRYFWLSTLLGGLLTLLVALAREPLAAWLNVPVPALLLTSFLLGLAVARPVVAGMLQGQQQFVAFGLTRSAFAIGRLLLAFLLIGLLGAGALGGVAALPLGAALALTLGLVALGRGVWERGEPMPPARFREGWGLSLAALLAYTAFMSLLNADLIWVNRTFAPAQAATYATAVVLRRVLSVLPGAVLVILYPRLVETLAQGRLPDRLLARAAVVVGGSSLLLALAYGAAGEALVSLLFGAAYAPAAPLLGMMAVAMIGYGFASIWMNLFLASRPWPFVLLLVAAAVAQVGLFARGGSSLVATAQRFGLGGWSLAVAGLALYLFWLRPTLRSDA